MRLNGRPLVSVTGCFADGKHSGSLAGQYSRVTDGTSSARPNGPVSHLPVYRLWEMTTVVRLNPREAASWWFTAHDDSRIMGRLRGAPDDFAKWLKVRGYFQVFRV